MTNQASEENISPEDVVNNAHKGVYSVSYAPSLLNGSDGSPSTPLPEQGGDTNQVGEDEKLAKLFHDTYERLAPAFNYKTRKASAVPWAEVPPNNKGLMIAVAHEINDHIRTEKLKLLAELDKSMPTAEQLTTKYGYHMPDKQYGYKLALHDIREVIAKLEAEL